MAGYSGEGKVSKQDLDDSLCEEDFSPTQMSQELLKLPSTNNNDKNCGSNSSSKDEDLQILVPPDSYSVSNDSTPVHLHDNAYTQHSPSILTNLQYTQHSPSILTNLQSSPQVINIHKRKPIFGKRNKSHSGPKYLITKKTPASTDNNGGKNLSPASDQKASDKRSKGATSGREKLKEKSITKKQATLNKSIKEPTSGGVKLKEKPSPKSTSKKMTINKSTEEKKNTDVGKPKKRASLATEEKAVANEQKRPEKDAKYREKEQKKIARERKREKNVPKEDNKRQLLKAHRMKDDCDKFSKGRVNVDERKEKFITQIAKEKKTKASAHKTSVKHPGMKDALEVNPKPILEEDDVKSIHDLQSQDPTEAASNIFSPDSSQSGLSSILDMGSHNTHLKFPYNYTVSPVVCNLKQPLPEDAHSTPPMPKRAKLDSNVVANFTKSLKTGSALKNGSGLHPKERNKKTKFDGGSRPLQKKSQTRTCKKANVTGPVWVKCCNTWCQKWRQLKDNFDPLTVPTFWKCTENSDKDCNDCSKPMEQWDSLENDDFQFVESAYVPGSLVWAKLGSYPWWPAMVEADPDEECYYEMGSTNSHVPVKYHVVFFDTPVSRSWLQAYSMVPFADVTDANQDHRYRVVKKYGKNLDEGMKQAKEALKIDVKERLDVYGFSRRHSAHSKKAAPLRKRPNTNPNRRTTKMKIHKRNLKGEEKEDEVMTVTKKGKLKEEQEITAKKEEVGTEEEVRMEWEKGENDEQGPSAMLLQPED